MTKRVLLALALLALVACGKSSLGKPETFKAEEPDGTPATAIHVGKAAAVVEKRLSVEPYKGSEVEARDASILVHPPKALTDIQREVMRRLVMRSGSFEIRAVAPADLPVTENGPAPAGWAWAADAHGGKLIIEVPEHGKSGDDRVRALRERVFTDADVARVSVEKRGKGSVVLFTLKEERKEAFRKFTADLVKRQIAILVDGVIQSSPEVKAPLAGAGVIDGGAAGFNAQEANELAAVLSAGRLSVHLFQEELQPPEQPQDNEFK